jgi:SAM-dependent methyltransferase
MIKLAKQRLGTQAEIRLADLDKSLDFLEDKTFDIVLSALVLDYVHDWYALFQEFARILKRNGRFIFSVTHPYTAMWSPEEHVRPPTYYWTTERVEIEWTGMGVVVPSYRRPIEAMIDPLRAAGLVVERILEPQPTEECRRLHPKVYEKTTRLPYFMCIRARKEKP